MKASLLTAKIALGTVQFGLDYGISNSEGKTGVSEVESILNAAHKLGIRMLDSAQAYGDSEKILGKLHDNRFDIVTKIQPNSLTPDITTLLNASLERLNVQNIYAIMFHSAKSALENEKAVHQIFAAKEQKIVSKIGYSVYTPNELRELIDKFSMPDIIQIPFSHLDQRFKEIATELHRKGVEIHSRSTFLQGLVFLKPEELNDFFDPIKPYMNCLNRRFLSNEIKAAALLKFVINQPYIDKVIIGVNNSEQLIENIKCLSSPISLDIIPEDIPEQILIPNLWPVRS